MNPPDVQRPNKLPGEGPVEGPISIIGYRINELNPSDVEKETRDLGAGLENIEAFNKNVTEQSGRFLVVVNGGGIMACLGVVTALVSSGEPVVQVLPGAFLFIIGLAFCGFGLMTMGRRGDDEFKKYFDDLHRVVISEMTHSQVVQRALYRRKKSMESSGPAFFFWSFFSFICGAIATVSGLAWAELFPLIVRFLHFLCSLI